MNVNKFLLCLKELDEEIDKQIEIQDGNERKSFEEIQKLFQKLSEILPDWFFFVEQTEIGTKQHILTILSDMEEAMRANDSILLFDALIYGLQATVKEYVEIIDEAIGDE